MLQIAASYRITTEAVRIGPYTFPPGIIVFPNLYCIMNYSGNWENPTRFDPSRWSESQAALDSKTGSQRFVPFSIGPKACAGQQLALMELKVMLVMLLAAFEFKLASNMGGAKGVAAKTIMNITLQVDGGLWFTSSRRPRQN
eukprot:jgi/Chrzof1/883/Cz01g32180.t1